MKQIFCLFILSAFVVSARADKEPRATNILSSQGSVQFKFNHLAPATEHKDSVLIIFDRFNHTGAGVIYNVFTANNDQSIDIQGIPEGKYYVTIKGLGVHRDRLEKIVNIKARKNEKVKINLQDSEEFDKDKVVIPVYQPNTSNLGVIKKK